MYHVILVKAHSYWYFDSGSFNKSEINRLYKELLYEHGLSKDQIYLCQSDSAEKKDIEKIIHAKNSMLML